MNKTKEQARLAKALHARMEAIYRLSDHYDPRSRELKRQWENEAVQEFMGAMNKADMM